MAPRATPLVRTDRSVDATDEVRAVIAEADAAFASGDARRYSALFSPDAHLYMLYQEPAIGRDAIHERWDGMFERLDTSAWEPVTELVEVHGTHASVFATYTERLLDRRDGTRTLIRGRLAYWLRRSRSASWEITLLMYSHSHRPEPLP
jgi:uncharacterized protein (TIGR02246 family)